MPRLSVHLSAKDAEATIAHAVASTLRALPRDSELVVLDDGSADRTAELVRAIDDPRLRMLERRPGGGIAAARRRLLAETDSELVAVMDADDVSLPWRFGAELRALRAGADLVVAPCVTFRTGPLRLRPGVPAPISAAAMPLHLLLGCPLVHPTLVARRAALDGIGGYRADAVAEDFDLYLRAAAAGLALVRVGVPTLGYRLHDAQTSGNTPYHAEADADHGLDASYLAFVQAAFGVDGRDWPDDLDTMLPVPEARAIIAAAVERRRLPVLQRRLVARYFRARTGEAL